MSIWTIHQAEERDAEALMDFMGVMAGERFTHTSIRPISLPSSIEALREYIRAYRSRNNTLLLVVRTSSDEIVGMLRLTGGSDALTAHSATLMVGVREDYRGQGLGSDLLKHAVTWAKINPYVKRIELEVLDRSKGSHHLYEKAGFVLEGKREHAYRLPEDGRYVPAILMACYV